MAKFTSPLINSLISLGADVSVFLTIFGILFYLDNKRQFINEKTQRRDSSRVKWVLIKLASTLSAAEIEHNTVKPAIHFWLLTLHYQPFVAPIIASFITIIGYIAVADSMVHISLIYLKNHSMN